MDREVVEIFSDGACRGNPGPGGWGALLRAKGTERELYGGGAGPTNNRMELTAAIRALEAPQRPSRVRLSTDPPEATKGKPQPGPDRDSRRWRPSGQEPAKNGGQR